MLYHVVFVLTSLSTNAPGCENLSWGLVHCGPLVGGHLKCGGCVYWWPTSAWAWGLCSHYAESYWPLWSYPSLYGMPFHNSDVNNILFWSTVCNDILSLFLLTVTLGTWLIMTLFVSGKDHKINAWVSIFTRVFFISTHAYSLNSYEDVCCTESSVKYGRLLSWSWRLTLLNCCWGEISAWAIQDSQSASLWLHCVVIALQMPRA